ncbi:capsule assembly Wzi family protein [Planktomarina temperata]|nr:capsule assembly Wzi family protein [Planktomarina temperata]
MNMFFPKPFFLSLLIALILNLSAVKLSASELQKEQSLSSANEVTLQLNSGDSPSIWRRDDSGVKLQKLFTVEDLYANLSATATDGDIMWDGSYIEYKSRNWLFGVGKKGRHWSPSRYNSLILSQNARPVPSVYLRYRTDFALDVPLLKYFGPIEAETFNGQLEQARGVPGAMLFGARFKFSPTRDLDLGLFRTAQWGGGEISTARLMVS